MRRTSTKVLRIIGLAVLTLSLAACSAFKLIYGQLPDMAYWWIDSYVDFNEAQSPRVRREWADLHAWHRANELPRYLALVQRMQVLAAQPAISPEQACEIADAARLRYAALAPQIEPAAAWLAQNLTASQLTHLQAKFDKNNEAWSKDWLRGSAEDRLKRRVKQAVDRAEMLYDRLSDAQIEALRGELSRSSYNAQTLWAERLRRQQDIGQTLRQTSSGPMQPASIREAVHGLLARTIDSPNTAYRRYVDQTQRENCAIFSRLHASITPAQRAAALENLKRYEDDFRALMAAR